MLIGVIVLGDGTGSRRWIGWIFFALAAYRAFEALREIAQGLRPDEEDGDEEDVGD